MATILKNTFTYPHDSVQKKNLPYLFFNFAVGKNKTIHTNHIKMKAKFKSIFLLLAVAFSAVPQAAGQVREADSLDAKVAIIRDIDGTNSIIYAFDNTNSLGLFALDDGTGTGLSYFYLPQSLYVKDVETDGTMVYFCGGDGNYGIIGSFDWKDVYYHNGQVMYISCSNPSQDGFIIVKEYTKMDFFFDGQWLVFALVGNSLTDWALLLNRTVISSAYEQIPGTWHFDHFYNKDGEITYTDIAALDDAVVAVGESYGNGCYWKAFRQVRDFPTQPYDFGHVSEISYTSAEGPSLIARTDHNRAAVAHHGDGTLTTHRLDADLTTGRPVAYSTSYYMSPQSTLPYGSNWILHDLQYNKILYVLDDADHDGTNNIMPWVIDLPVTSSPAATDAKTKFQEMPLSMSVKDGVLLPIMAGISSTPKLRLYDPLNMTATTPCDDHRQPVPVYGQPIVEDKWISHDNPFFTNYPRYFLPTIIDTPTTVICN